MVKAVEDVVVVNHVRAEIQGGMPSEVMSSILIIRPINLLKITKATFTILTVLIGSRGWTTFPGNQIPEMRNTIPKVSKVIPIYFQLYSPILYQNHGAAPHPNALHPGLFSPLS